MDGFQKLYAKKKVKVLKIFIVELEISRIFKIGLNCQIDQLIQPKSHNIEVLFWDYHRNSQNNNRKNKKEYLKQIMP